MAKLDIFKTVAKGAARKSTLAMLAQVHCEHGRIWATDCDVFISAPAPEECANNTSYDLKGRALAVYGGDETAIGSITSQAFDGPYMHDIDLPAILASVSHAISKEETRYYLNGAYFDTEGGRLKVVATDGHRMAVLETGEPVQSELQSVIIPRQAIAVLAGIKGELWRVTWNERFAQFVGQNSGIELVTKLIDGCYPDYGRVIPQSSRLVGSYTGQAVNALAALKDCKQNAEGREPKVIISGAELHVRNNTLANYQGALPADIHAAEQLPQEIGFNTKYLCDAMAAIGKDSYRLQVSDAASPVRVESGDGKLIQVVMPLRV